MGQKYADLMTLGELAAVVQGQPPAAQPAPRRSGPMPAPRPLPAPASLAEVREDAATGETAAIYNQLRQASGVPLVNLIWRHAATMPGMLPWAWDMVEPALKSGAVAAATRRVAKAVPLPPLSAVDPVRDGMQLADLGRILDLVETYNRGNLTNLILLTALRRRLEDGPAAQRAQAPAQAAPPRMLPPVPPIPKLDSLPPALAAAVQGLAARHGPLAQGVIPSLYLHLALWPPAVDALPRWLGDALTPEGIARGRDAAVAAAAPEAAAIHALLADIPAPDAATTQLLPVLRTFTTEVIPAMVPIGLALRAVLAGD